MKKLEIYVSVLLILFVIAASYYYYLLTYTPIFQTPILSVSNCSLPCWNDIHVGKTTLSEFRQILDRLAFVGAGTVEQVKYGNDILVVFRATPSRVNLRDIRGEAIFRNEIIIHLSLDGPLNNSMEDIVDMIGEPDLVFTSWPPLEYTVKFVNTKKGVAFGSGFSKDDVNLTKDLSIEHIDLFDPVYFDQLLDERFFKKVDNTYPWSGYGILKEKYFPKEK